MSTTADVLMAVTPDPSGKVGLALKLGGRAAKAIRWKLGPNDIDFRGSGKGVQDVLDTAFERTGLPRTEFEATRWGRDANGKSFPAEWRHKSGVEVNVDWAHAKNGPDAARGIPYWA